MIDARLLPFLYRLYARPARVLASRGVTADALSIGGFAIGTLSVPALAVGWTGVALALILANRIADGLDGAVARIDVFVANYDFGDMWMASGIREILDSLSLMSNDNLFERLEQLLLKGLERDPKSP